MQGRILVVDDDIDFQSAMSTLLEAKGYEVITASEGEEGFKKAKDVLPDLIMLDVMMAYKTEGIEIAKRIHSEESLKGIPVIMTTGIRKDMNLPFGLESHEDFLPVKEIIEKPVKPQKILSTISKYIRKK